MIAITINAITVILGSAIGALARKGIHEKYITVMNTAMGLAALVLGINVAMTNMQKTAYPVLFIFCLSLGGLLGTLLKLDQRMDRAMSRLSKGSNLSEGITTAVLLCCVGTLAIMGPVNSALYGDDTFLMTLATMNLVTMIVIASSYGFGTALTAIIVFVWMSTIYGIAKLSQTFISEELITEVSLVGGVLIAASGLGVLHIKDCKTINLLPALIMPMLFFLIKSLFFS
ncbi:transport protein [gut metagenome]|uniref:Transport protein n=1 Tax=gut metagenome TaxID=749906 RepID=J9GWP2_9ZZZZ